MSKVYAVKQDRDLWWRITKHGRMLPTEGYPKGLIYMFKSGAVNKANALNRKGKS